MSNRNPDGTIGPASVKKFVKSGPRNIASTTSAAAPIRPPPRTPVALISRTRALAVIPGQSRRCFTLEGLLLVMDCSALSANDHVPSHDAPVLDFDSGSHLFLQVLIVRHGCLECLIIFHVHHLEKISEMESTCPVRLSISGTSALPSTGLMRFFFWPVNALIATILAFAEPCLPGLDFSNSTILHGSPSMRTYWPIFKLPTSTGLLMKLRLDSERS